MTEVFWKTRDWWCEGDPPNHAIGVSELIHRYDQGAAHSTWAHRRRWAVAHFPDLDWLRLTIGAHTQRQNAPFAVDLEAPCPVDQDALVKALKGGSNLIELANIFDVSPATIERAVDYLRDQKHLLVAETAAGLTLASEILPTEDVYAIDTLRFAEQEFCFGITADNHLGSKYERMDVVEDLFDRWAADGVTDVFVAGNYIDGSGRRFNVHDIYVHGVEEQIANFLAKWPQREGIVSHILSGDDHEGWFVQDAHVNIGHVLESEAVLAGRSDIIDLGYMERDIELVQEYGSSTLRIAHAGGGSAYATSYTAQKYVEALQGGEKPQIAVLGHYHKFDYNYPREVHVLQPGSTQDQTPFMRKRKLQSMLGGCTMWLRQNELGIITSCKVEWRPYYDKKFYAYQWQGSKTA